MPPSALLGLLALLLWAFVSTAPAAGEVVPTVAVMNFINRSHDPEWQWLSKGLADMLVTDLSQTRRLRVVERERIQEFLDELALSGSGLVEKDAALQLGRLAKVDKALFGSYLIKDGRIEIAAHVIDVDSQALQRVDVVRGRVDDLLDLEKQLALNIVENFHLTLTKEELGRLRFKPTDSLDAATRFYQGLDAYDNGEYFDAIRDFRLAKKKDAGYDKPRLFLGHVYENLGEYRHAVLELEKLAADIPTSPSADDALFLAANVHFHYLDGSREALRLADRVIKSYPEAVLSRGVQISAGKQRSVVLNMWARRRPGHAVPMESVMRVFKHDVFVSLGEYRRAAEELIQADALMPRAGLSLFRSVLEQQIADLVEEAYAKKGVVIVTETPRVILLDPKQPVYLEDYTTDKRLRETFRLDDAYHMKGQPRVKKHRYAKAVPGHYLHNLFDPEKNQWYSVTDLYVFAAPEGYVVESVEADLDGFQREPWTVRLLVSAVGDIPPAMSLRGQGNISQSQRFTLIPGTRFFKVEILVAGDFTKKTDQWGYLDRWRIRANLKRVSRVGTIAVDSTVNVAAFLDPPGPLTTVQGINWRTMPYRDCPCRFFDVPAGTYRLVAFAASKGLSVYQDGRRQEQQVRVKHGETTRISFQFAEKPTEDLSAALPGWSGHRKVADAIKVVGEGGHVFTIQLLEDRKGTSWILFSQDGDLWFTSSVDSKTWTPVARLPAPVSTQATEKSFSIIQGEDGRFYIAFISARADRWGVFVSSSREMERWTRPVRVATLKHGYSPLSLIQLKDGSFRLYLQRKGSLMSFGSSRDTKVWSEFSDVELQYQNLLQVVTDSLGRFWMLLGGYYGEADREHVLFVQASGDGVTWQAPQLIQPSVTNHNLASFHPVLVETQQRELALMWERTARLAFSRSRDGKRWTSSNAEMTSQGKIAYPNAPASFVSRRDGTYMLAYVNGYGELWVSVSEDPFY